MPKRPSTITTLPPSPDDDRRRRMIMYSITMGIRFACIIACLFVRGWPLALCAAGAVLLPYFAVIIANATDARAGQVSRPGAVARLPRAMPPGDDRESDS